jgi:hypothetical protein
MYRVTGPDGRSIAAYKFGDPSEIRSAQLSGRTAFTSALKAKLIDKYGARCNIYLEAFPERDLQIDHRVPFEIAGDNGDLLGDVDEYMLLCASANRAKSWSCEHCPNWKVKDINVCRSCYWSHPESYTHIATRQMRRLDLLWSGQEILDYAALVEAASEVHEEPAEYVKQVLRSHLKYKDDQ